MVGQQTYLHLADLLSAIQLIRPPVSLCRVNPTLKTHPTRCDVTSAEDVNDNMPLSAAFLAARDAANEILIDLLKLSRSNRAI